MAISKRKANIKQNQITADGYKTPGGIHYTIAEIPPRESSVEDKVQFIMRLMHNLRFETGETNRVLSAFWELSLDIVKKYSTEAHRRVMSNFDPEEVGRLLSAALTRVVIESAANGDKRSLISAGKTLAEITGASKQRINVSIQPDKLSDDELKKLAAEAIAVLNKEK